MQVFSLYSKIRIWPIQQEKPTNGEETKDQEQAPSMEEQKDTNGHQVQDKE